MFRAPPRYLCVLGLLIVLRLTPYCLGVDFVPPEFSPKEVRLGRQWSYVQMESSKVMPRTGKIFSYANIVTKSTIPFGLRVEVAGASYPMKKGLNELTAFDSATIERMEAGFPTSGVGRAVAFWSWGQESWLVEMSFPEPLPQQPVITNFESLQMWNGGPLAIEWKLPPLFNISPASPPWPSFPGEPRPAPSGYNFYLYRASSIDFASDAQLIKVASAPPSGIVLEGIQAALGETLYGELRGATYDNIGYIRFPIRRAAAPDAPTILNSPRSQTILVGERIVLSIHASGSGLTYQWFKDGEPLSGATNSTLDWVGVAASSGRYTVVVTNSGGQVVSEPAVIAVLIAPKIEAAPVSRTILMGEPVQLSITITGSPPFTYQWLRNGAPIPNATSASLTVSNARTTDQGSYTLLVQNLAGSVTSGAATIEVLPVTRIANFSIRSAVSPGSPLTVGFSIGGAAVPVIKPVLIRAMGPTLVAFGVGSALADPQLLIRRDQTEVAQNDNWEDSPLVRTTSSAVGAFSFSHGESRDAAVIYSAPSGSYTAQITGGAATGIALAEVYDAVESNDFSVSMPRLTNVSALTHVGSGGDILIAGFSITGTSSRTILIRGIGPTLAAFGVFAPLSDPRLELYQNGATPVYAANDNWGAVPSAIQVAAAASSVAAFALATESRDAALLVTLPPGSYTAQVHGVGGAQGIALVEIYEIP